MDGLTDIEKITRDYLLMAGEKMLSFNKVMAKSAAMYKIRSQPFFGDYWSGKKCGDTIKIRRPVQYMRTTKKDDQEWMG